LLNILSVLNFKKVFFLQSFKYILKSFWVFKVAFLVILIFLKDFSNIIADRNAIKVQILALKKVKVTLSLSDVSFSLFFLAF